MKTRLLVALSAAVLSCAAWGAPPSTPTTAKVLRFVPQLDLKVLDPIFTTSYVTRNFAHLVYDTLFAIDAKGAVQPQMVEKYSVSKDGLRWSFTLRPGLKFHDGAPVTAADCVASLQRWADKDSHGRAMVAAGARWEARDAQTLTLTLKEPFGLVLESLAKVSSLPPVIMPQRLVQSASNGPLSEVMGSGPFIFRRDEWVPGSKVVFVRNPHYVGRAEPTSFLAGNKKAGVDRLEWVVLPDANSATAALKNGEVDMLEAVQPDNIPSLQSDRGLALGTGGAYQGALVVNNLTPPFNNTTVRQALLKAVDQERFMAGMGYPQQMRVKHCPSFFICGKPNETTAGSQPYARPDVAAAKQLLAASGYKGEKVVLMVPTDHPSLNGGAMVALQTMKAIGLNVEAQSMDWASIVSRRVRKDPVEAGGWSAYVTFAAETSADSPLNNFMLGAACGNSMPGWPCDQRLDELRAAWLRESSPAKRKEILDAFQSRAYEVVPYIPLGQYSGAFAVSRKLRNAERIVGDVPSLWALEK